MSHINGIYINIYIHIYIYIYSAYESTLVHTIL